VVIIKLLFFVLTDLADKCHNQELIYEAHIGHLAHSVTVVSNVVTLCRIVVYRLIG